MTTNDLVLSIYTAVGMLAGIALMLLLLTH